MASLQLKRMKLIVKLTTYLILTFLITSCAERVHQEHFLSVNSVQEYGKISVNFYSSLVSSLDKKVIRRGSPYTIAIGFSDNQYLGSTYIQKNIKPLSVDDIKITSTKGVLLYEIEGGAMEVKEQLHSTHGFWQKLPLKHYDLPYQSMQISFNLVLDIDGEKVKKLFKGNIKYTYIEIEENIRTRIEHFFYCFMGACV